MRLLLDTNAVIWWLAELPLLGDVARDAIGDDANEVYISAVTSCEISIKTVIGKLSVPGDLEETIIADDFTPLPVTVRHGMAVSELPLHHRDPFDRILIAQARCEDLTLVTADRRFGAYDVPVLDARR